MDLVSDFTSPLFPHGWVRYLGGGLLIGLAVALAFVTCGFITGMSSVFTTTWSYFSRRAFFQQRQWLEGRSWRLVHAAGLIVGAAVWWILMGPPGGVRTEIPAWQLLVGGILVGYGARLSGGCTSGHGICGLASRQLPSLLAVLIFMAAAFLTANLVRALGWR